MNAAKAACAVLALSVCALSAARADRLAEPVQAEKPRKAEPQPMPKLAAEPELRALIPDRSLEIGLEPFKTLRAEKSTVVLDLRSPAAFKARHIKGSVNLPLGEVTEKTLPKAVPDKSAAVVLVCDDSFFPTRRIAMTLQAEPVLLAAGYKKIYRLNLWQSEGRIVSDGEIEKSVPFEGTEVKKR